MCFFLREVQSKPLRVRSKSVRKPSSGTNTEFMVQTEGSQTPRHLIGDAHEWINVIPTVPTHYLAKQLLRERT